MNVFIEEEILRRLATAKKNQPEMPSELSPVLEYFEKQSFDALVNLVMKDLANVVAQWSIEEKVQTFGFGWNFKGDIPYLLASGHAAAKRLPIFNNRKSRASKRALGPFDGNIWFGEKVFDLYPGIDVVKACYPLYECKEAELGLDKGLSDEAYNGWEHLKNIFILRLFLAMHIALKHLAQTEIFKSFTISPFYVFAEVSYDCFFVYAESDSDTAPSPLQDVNNLSMEVEELKDWLDSVKQKILWKKKKEEIFERISHLNSAELQECLFNLPDFKMDENVFRLGAREWVSAYRLRLGDPDILQNISFDAIFHLFDLVVATYPDVYPCSDSLAILFLKDPCRAKEKILEIYAQSPSKARSIRVAAQNALQWVSSRPSGQIATPMLSLYRNRLAKTEMAKIAGDD